MGAGKYLYNMTTAQHNNAFARYPALQALDIFAGVWKTSGIMSGNSEGQTVPIEGTDTYEWVSGGYFLLHKVDVMIGGTRNETTELIGYDPKTGTYPMHYFDNNGHTGTMKASLHNGTWTFLGESLRFTGGFSPDGGQLTGNWEAREGTTWKHLMKIELTRSGK